MAVAGPTQNRQPDVSYWQLYYHLIFSTRERQPLPDTALRTMVARLLTSKTSELHCTVHALHVQPDHVHMVVSIPPTLAVATVVGQLKGSSSHALARTPEGDGFRWQEEYGILSFGRRNLPDVVRYVQDQERRHAQRDLWPELERTGAAVSAPPKPHATAATPSAGLSRLRDRSPAIDGRAFAEENHDGHHWWRIWSTAWERTRRWSGPSMRSVASPWCGGSTMRLAPGSRDGAHL